MSSPNNEPDVDAPPDPPSQRLRVRLLEAFVEEAPRLGWTVAAMNEAARKAGLNAGEVELAAPRGPHDLADAFADRADQAMLAALGKLDLPAMRIRAKVRAAVQARLDAQAPYKEAAAALTRYLARPGRAGQAAALVWRTADRIWRALGDLSTDENYYSKRAILSGVLGSTYARWLADASPDGAATASFLDARIENVMQFEKLKSRLPPAGSVREAIVGAAARFRYGTGAG